MTRGKEPIRAVVRGAWPLVLGLCLCVGLAGCARSRMDRRATLTSLEKTDPYQKALQDSLIRQQLGQLQKGTGGYRFGLHDVIEIHVFEYEKMNTVTRVGDNGCISFPPVGELRVVGLTERQLETLLQDRLRGKYLQDPHVTVLVKEPHAMEVAIVGEVAKPGTYSLLGEKGLLDLLAQAGGMTEKAGNIAYLIRIETSGSTGTLPAPLTSATLLNPAASLLGPGATSIKVDLDGLLIRGEEKWNYTLKSGDLVNIPQAGWVHVTGRGVEKPGTIPLTRSAKTLLQILDEAGGMKWEAGSQVFVVRKTEDGGEKVLRADYQSILDDNRNDVPLVAGDTIITDRKAFKTVLAAIGRTLAKMVHLGISVPLI